MRKSRFCKNFILSCIIFVFALPVQAVSDPLAMMQNTSNQMLNELQQNRANLKQNPHIVYRIITRDLLPHVDSLGMSRSVLGRQVWESASTEQQHQFVKEFTDLVIRNYAVALASYNDQSVQFLPLREQITDQKRLQINSIIIQPDGRKIPVNYFLAKVDDDWKIYDINVNDISFLQSYRSQFAAIISQSSFSDLLEKLKKQNVSVNVS